MFRLVYLAINRLNYQPKRVADLILETDFCVWIYYTPHYTENTTRLNHLQIIQSPSFQIVSLILILTLFYFHDATAPSGWGPPLYRVCTITLRHTHTHTHTLGRTSLDEWSVHRRDLYLTRHNTHNRKTPIPTVGFEPAVPASKRPQTHTLHRASTGIGIFLTLSSQIRMVFTVAPPFLFSNNNVTYISHLCHSSTPWSFHRTGCNDQTDSDVRHK